MTDEEILTRIAQGEDSRTQFKRGVYVLPYRGLGTGVMRAISLGAQISFESDRELNIFKVTIQRKAVSEPINEPIKRGKKASEPINEPIKRAKRAGEPINEPIKGAKKAGEPINEPIKIAVFKYVKKHPGCKRDDICAAMGLSIATIKRTLTHMKSKVEYRGSNKTGGYYVAGK